MSTRTGEGKVKALEPVQRRDGGKPHRRGVLLAAAVFIVVVDAGLALALALRGTTEDVVEVPAPPFETGEDAMAAFDSSIRSGDYEAFQALFAVGVEDFFGSDAVTDQRKRERDEWNSLATNSDVTEDARCVPNDVVERSWTCTMPHPHVETGEILAAAGVLGGPGVLMEIDVSLSEDGLISRVSDLRFVDPGAHGQALSDFKEWLATHDPELRAAEDVLFFRSDHEADPLLMPIPAMVERYQAGVDDYVEFLEGGGNAGAIPAPPFETGEDAAEGFYQTLASGDYEAFTAMFAPDAPSYFGDASVSNQRLRERFEFEAAAQGTQPRSIACVANPTVESAWTCTSPMQRESLRRILVASDLQPTTPLADEFDIQLSPDGFIQRVSAVRVAGTGVAVGPITQFGIQPWLVANHPSLDENLTWLFGNGDHETFPLTMPPAEMAAQWDAALGEYAATLGDE